MTIWRMRIACWILKATNTHSDYVILIAFPLQQRSQEGVSMLHYTYIAYIVNNRVITVFYLEIQIVIFSFPNFI